MQLAIFDIDGTLTQSNELDNHCFAQAFAAEFGIATCFEQWHACPHVTDSGLTHHILTNHFGRAPLDAEIHQVQRRFLQLLADSVAAAPHAMPPLPGAVSAFERLQQQANWAVAIATGCWQASAHFKLQHAQINFAGVPTACADAWLAREEILNDAILQAQSHYQTVFDRVVYIGDGMWDVRTTRNLNLPFVGVGTGECAARLRNAGAAHIIPDFNDFSQFLVSLREAQVPQ
jgi:phosphoglycolate phosphatase-like HAD superfamily hydrolase